MIYWVGKKSFAFFYKFSTTVKKVLEAFILRVYKGDTNIFRAATTLWIWTRIRNEDIS
jgi:hypothetical protein